MDIATCLRSLGLEQYASAFGENDIDMRVLPDLTVGDLKDLGVTMVGHRRILLKGFLAEQAASASWVGETPASSASAARLRARPAMAARRPHPAGSAPPCGKHGAATRVSVWRSH